MVNTGIKDSSCRIEIITHNIRLWRHIPIFITSFREALHHIRLIPQEPQQTHNLLPTRPNPPQHITLLRLLEYKHQLVNTVNFVFNILDERREGVCDVVDERIGDPVGCDADVVFELFDPSSDVLWVGCRAKVEL